MTSIRGVINIGAHYGEQYAEWIKRGIKNFIFIEPVNENFEELRHEFGNTSNIKLFNVALANYSGKAIMYVDNKHLSFSASMLKPTGHLEDYPCVDFIDREEVDVTTLDLLDYDRTLYDYIYMTAQGMELDILKGAVNSLEHIKSIKMQVYRKPLYEGSFSIEEMTDFLHEQGFNLTGIEDIGISWGYATYKR